MQPFQQRVVEERDELGIKLSRLRGFVEYNENFRNLPIDEQERMMLQLQHMQAYHDVLIQRIKAFSGDG